MKIRLGVVGGGFGRYGLVPAFQMDSRCDLVAFCCRTLSKAQSIAKAVGVPHAYGDFETMLREAKLDAVAIATSPASQFLIAESALTRGLHVFAEKPLATTVKQAERLVVLAREAGVANMVDFLFPEIEAWRCAKELLRGGTIGAVHTCVVNWLFQSYDHSHNLVTWKTDRTQGGGVLSHFASHTLYYLESLLGPIRQVDAHLAKPVGYGRSGSTLLLLTLRFESGVTGAATVCSNAPFGSGHRVEFHGKGGSVILNNPSGTEMDGFTLWLGQSRDENLRPIECPETKTLPPDTDSRVLPAHRLACRFLDWIRTGKPERPDFADGARVQQLIAIIESLSP